jgi:hypothetical protein
LKRIDSKAIVLELDDFRVLEFKRTDKTKFLKAGEDAKPEIFKPGDRISIEASEDQEAYLTAVNVYWEKQGKPEAKETAPKENQPAGGEPVPERSVEMQPPPAPRDADDPGPPKLQRGKPEAAAARPAPREEPPQTAAAAPPPAVPSAPPVPLPGAIPPNAVERVDESLPVHKDDDLIRKAQDKALEFTETLPNYVCREMIARFQSETAPADWRPIDVVSADVVYDKGKEDYRNLKINGKPIKKGMEEMAGSWSTGEFGTILIDLFSPATSADFRFRRTSRTAGMDAKVYDFQVERENSHWNVRTGSQSFQPAYRGSVWIDPKTARVLRIEMQARNMPEEFPLDKVESAVDYEYVRLGSTQQFLLPVHSETLSCQRGTNRCSRNTIDFRNYHKYAGEADIQYEQQ